MSGEDCEVAVAGGGIVGLATAHALASDGRTVLVLEAEDDIARHQTGHNSGVIHAGLYYRPGSHKVRLAVAGRQALYRFCQRHGVPVEACGKVVVAVDEEERAALDALEARGRANGLDGLQRLDAAGIRAHEPHAAGCAGLFVPQTGIVDFKAVAAALARRLEAQGGALRTGARVLKARPEGDGLAIDTAAGTLRCRFLVACAGLHSDRLAHACGLEPGVRIVPFRGSYYEVLPARRHLVRHLIYPVPDPRFPFLGVHLTRTIDGRLEAGPNAVLALARHGYRAGHISLRDAVEILTYAGTWRLAARHAGSGLAELLRSTSRHRFAAALRRLVPDLDPDDIVPAGSGVRAQAVDRAGQLVDDFLILDGPASLHVLNAPSPAATAALAIGRNLADRVAARLAG